MSNLEDQGELEVQTTATPAVTPETGGDGHQDAAPPSSSGQDTPAPADQGPKSMAEAIEAALKATPSETAQPEKKEGEAAKDPADPNGSDKASDADPAKSTGTVEDGASEKDLEDPTDDEIKALKPKVQRRVQQLLSQRNESRRERDALKPDAESFQQIRNFMQVNSLQDSEVAELFEIGAALKSGDPTRLAQFLDRVMPTIQGVLEATGRSVPRDLREQVNNGELSEDAAKRLGQERYGRLAAEERARRTDQQVQTQNQTQATATIRNAVADWQTQARRLDPDFDLKADAMKRAAQAMVAEKGLPQTPEQAVEYAKAAYVEVNSWMSRAKPAPKPTKPAPASGPSANRTGLTPQANSLTDIVKNALEAAARR